MKCPCCGGETVKIDPRRLTIHLGFTPQQRKIYTTLANHFNEFVPAERVVDAMYKDDPNGGPDCAHNVLRMQLVAMRKALAEWNVEISKHLRGGYVLRWAEEKAA